MRRLVIVTCVVLLMAAAFHAGDIITAKRIVIFNDDGKTAVVLMSDARGGGELAIYDADGREVFGIHAGRLTGSIAKELRQGSPTASAPAAQGARSARVMMFESVVSLAVDGLLLKEAARLRKEATEFDDKARSLEGQIATSVGDSDRSRKLRSGYRQLKLSAEQDAKRLRARATSLTRQANEPHHQLEGWDGKRSIVLTTTRDLSRVITTFRPGDFVEWQGTRVEMTDLVDIFEVKVLRLVSRPAGFTPRP